MSKNGIKIFRSSKSINSFRKKSSTENFNNQISYFYYKNEINKYVSFSGQFSRAMNFGEETAEMAMINLVVSDGDPSRGQRESLLSNEIKKVCVANEEHEVYRHCSAIITSAEFDNTFDKDNNGLLIQNKSKNRKSIEKNKNDEEKLNNLNVKKDENKKNEKINEGVKIDKKKNTNGKEDLPLGVASINKTEKIVVENGDKKKVTKIIKVMEDGSQRIETIKEILEE